MPTSTKNYTFSLPVGTVEKLRQYVRKEHIASLNAGVREAIEEYAARLDREQFKREMLAAGKDESFLADLWETMHSFAHADAEAVKRSGE